MILFCSPAIYGSELPTSFRKGFRAAEAEQEFFQTTPDGLPTGFAIAFSTEEATELGQSTKEFTHRSDRPALFQQQWHGRQPGDGSRGFPLRLLLK